MIRQLDLDKGAKDDKKEIRGIRDSIFNLKDSAKNVLINKVMNRFSSSIVLTSYMYGSSDILKYITGLYPASVRDGNNLLEFGLIGDNNKIRRKLPFSDIEFITKDNRTLCQLKMVKLESAVSGYTDRGIRITFIGRYAYKYMKGLITLYRKTQPKKKDGIMAISQYDYRFNTSVRLELCTFDDVILRDKEEFIIKPLNDFLGSKELYKQYKCTYNTGFLLHGKPGTGKSTTIKAIINHCIDKGYETIEVLVLDLSKKMNQFSDDIKRIYTNSTYRADDNDSLNIIIMEEVDSIFGKNDRKGSTTVICEDGSEVDTSEDSDNKLKLNLLLQFLDGSISPHNTIFIATTNYIDNLDEAFMRDGRFDNKVPYEYFNKEEALQLCKKFGCNENNLIDITYPIAPVTLQKLMFKTVKEKMKPTVDDSF